MGIEGSLTFVSQPEGNGLPERAVKLVKEQNWGPCFPRLEEIKERIKAFIAQYNQEWPSERPGYRSPTEARGSP